MSELMSELIVWIAMSIFLGVALFFISRME